MSLHVTNVSYPFPSSYVVEDLWAFIFFFCGPKLFALILFRPRSSFLFFFFFWIETPC
ncbi:unnamed protein product [Prunus brigantina]